MTSRIPATIVACAALVLGASSLARAGEHAGAATPALLAAADPASRVVPLLPEADEAGMCRVDDPAAPRAVPMDTAAKLAQIRALLAAQAEGAEEAGFVPLDNRGYNYRSSAIVDPGLVRFEAQRLAR